MSKEKNSASSTMFLRLLSSFFSSSPGSGKLKSSRSTSLHTGPEAAMVAAAKHFSSAHKINLG